ncbi:recombinase RecT [Anaeroselena agilis]|uniref:Recombinase RecT n=1 Tax=Anaeroselena agilis TaxID=3063788 RepID=A0ABU3NWD7_9FIRM|nr:recombinase RecT [Selenomonadales bacterium 4137-cl]
MAENKNAVEKAEKSMSARFMEMVFNEFTSGVGELSLTDSQRRLAQNYFIVLDSALKTAEEKRVKGNAGKEDRYKNNLPYTWANVDLETLSRNVVSAARMGLDPLQKNHINMVPFKNNAIQKYGIGFIDGYRGLEVKATKYGLDVPVAVIVEVVYSTDTFKPIKKDLRNNVESFEFEVNNAFDRGEIIGGFYYLVYSDQTKNRLVVMSKKEIEKRKPAHASVEFWGGEKDVWENGKKVGKEKVEGWYEQMVYKTLYRAAYGSITVDSTKIDADYMRLAQAEKSFSEGKIEDEIAEHANSQTLDIAAEVMPPDSGEPIGDANGPSTPAPAAKANVTEHPAAKAQQTTLAPTGTDGPGY